jgi:hypothetical protein
MGLRLRYMLQLVYADSTTTLNECTLLQDEKHISAVPKYLCTEARRVPDWGSDFSRLSGPGLLQTPDQVSAVVVARGIAFAGSIRDYFESVPSAIRRPYRTSK